MPYTSDATSLPASSAITIPTTTPITTARTPSSSARCGTLDLEFGPLHEYLLTASTRRHHYSLPQLLPEVTVCAESLCDLSPLASPPPVPVAELRDSTGALVAAGSFVRFTTMSPGASTDLPLAPIVVAARAVLDASNGNSLGRASVIVRLGTIAVRVPVTVSAPRLPLTETINHTVKAAGTSQTTESVVVGRANAFQVWPAHLYQNYILVPTTWSVSGPGATATTVRGVGVCVSKQACNECSLGTGHQ